MINLKKTEDNFRKTLQIIDKFNVIIKLTNFFKDYELVEKGLFLRELEMLNTFECALSIHRVGNIDQLDDLFDI